MKPSRMLSWIVLVLALSSPFAYADVSRYDLYIDLENPTQRNAKVSVTNGTTLVPILENFQNITSDHNLTISNGSIVVIAESRTEILFSYISSDPIKAGDSENVVTIPLKPSRPLNSFFLTVNLPSMSVVRLDDGEPLVSSGGMVNTDGERISVTWRSIFGANESKTFFVVYAENGSGGSRWVYSLLALLIVALSVPATWLGYRSLKRKFWKKGKSAKSEIVLTDEEQNVMGIIDMYNNKCLQTDIIREMAISKAKASKLLRSMEVKGLIDRKPYGKTNMIKRK